MNGYQHTMNKINVTKHKKAAEILISTAFFILLSEPHTAHGSCRDRPFDNKLLEFQEQSRQTVPLRQLMS